MDKKIPIGPQWIKLEVKDGEKPRNIYKSGKWYKVGNIGCILCPTCHMPLPDETDDSNMREVHTPLGWKTSGRHYKCVEKGGKYAENFTDVLNKRWLVKR